MLSDPRKGELGLKSESPDGASGVWLPGMCMLGTVQVAETPDALHRMEQLRGWSLGNDALWMREQWSRRNSNFLRRVAT